MTDTELTKMLRSSANRVVNYAADRIKVLTAERDAAYANGYRDAETEISKSALGQRNDFLHSQYANAMDHIKVLTAERDHAWEMAAKADTQMGQSLADNLQAKAERDEAWAYMSALQGDLYDAITIEAERDQLRIALTDAERYLKKGLDKMAYNIIREALKGETP